MQTVSRCAENPDCRPIVFNTFPGFQYKSVVLKSVQAAQQLIDRFCGGFVEELLVGLVDNQLLKPKELRRLAEKIASRKEKIA
jgi:hypothetical protein